MFSPNPTSHEIFLTRLFEEPLAPIGAEPTPEENAALVAALEEYSNRSGPDDFSGLTSFLEKYPSCPWDAALLINLGLEYYNTGHYSKALEAWSRAWQLAKSATELKEKALADRAAGELAYLHARLGQMAELDALLKSVEGRSFSGPATEKITGAREGLATMRDHPEIAFRCGPLALHRIKLSVGPQNPEDELIETYQSTPKGCSLRQVEDWSRQLGLNLQMAFRDQGAAFVVPSVVHLKLDHYAALVRQEGERYLLEDPTFGNDVWVTREALAAETSGYCLLPSGKLEHGWRAVEIPEGETVWGKGFVNSRESGPTGPCDEQTQGGNECDDDCKGMAIPHVHLMVVSLNIKDEPVGYTPPIGPAVRFMVRYNQRDAFQPSLFAYSNFGPKWTFDWLSYITDNPSNPLADVNYYIMGGGTRTFRGFESATQTYAFQQYDQTRLTRTSPTSYEMLSPDGTRKIFSQPDGSIGTSRKVFLTRLIDLFGNAVSLSYDANLRVTALTDAIGQVTTISYDHPTDIFKITKVTDPFGRFATFDYDVSGRLIKIRDVIGLTSEFSYDAGDFITALTTPYGVTSFTKSEQNTTRILETLYPDGYSDRVEFNQAVSPFPDVGPPGDVPSGMATNNNWLKWRNTYYWDKIALASARGDYNKAKIFHWLKIANAQPVASGILESVKEPLERRVWYNYAGQTSVHLAGSSNKPAHVGRVLDDGSTQLYTYEYNGLGNVMKTIDPVGRTFSYLYADNGIDLLEIRQTRAGQNQLLSRKTYNTQHLPLTSTDAAGQTTTYTYNTRGQLLTETNPKGETTTYSYNDDGYLLSINGPLPGSSTTFTYDIFGRVRTKTDESGYTLTFDYDALDHLTRITYPDSTFDQYTYTRLDPTEIQDRAGRKTFFEYNSVRQQTKRTDPLNRVTLYQWCKCGDLKSLTDPMGRTTTWRHDIQGRVKEKEYADGSKITYRYANTTSRLTQRIDEKLQVTQYNYNRDDTLSRISYANVTVPTPSVAFTYDANYRRLKSMTDGIGVTRYAYIPITPVPLLGAGQLARVDGPLPDDTIIYTYDELGRRVAKDINGVTSSIVFDAAGRVTSEANALGTFDYTYDGSTRRPLSRICPNGLTTTFTYLDNFGDRRLERLTNTRGENLISEFSYVYDTPAGRITTWSEKSGTQAPLIHTLGYDAANQLRSASRSQTGQVLKSFAYTYDLVGNHVTQKLGEVTRRFLYNALNELTNADSNIGVPAVYQWDAAHRLVSVRSSNNRLTRFDYDGFGRRVGIREEVGSVEVSNKRYIWSGSEICEERTVAGEVVKRFFHQGMKVETGASVGRYFYTTDHLGSIRDLIDDAGSVRARFGYDPFGARSRTEGDIESDFGFTGHFYHTGTALCLTKFRAYDPELARWLSRDPLANAERLVGPNLYEYVDNNPINLIDPSGTGPWEIFECLRKGFDPLFCYYQEYKRFCSNWLDDDSDDEDDPERDKERCEKVRDNAVKQCESEIEGAFDPWFEPRELGWAECLNDKLRAAGCLGKGY